jgi:hypothetical protein
MQPSTEVEKYGMHNCASSYELKLLATSSKDRGKEHIELCVPLLSLVNYAGPVLDRKT